MILVAVWAVMAPAPTAATVLATVQKTYAAAKQLSMDFTQTSTQAAFGKATTSTGKLYVARPDKLRMDYTSKPIKMFIADGTHLWVVEPSKLAVTQLPAGTLPPSLAFLGGAALPPGVAFDTSGTFGGKGATVLALPVKQGTAQHVFLVVDPATGQVTESVVVEASGDTDDYRFAHIDTTTAIKPTVFAFSPASVPTYKVITPPAAAPTPTTPAGPTTPPAKPPPPAKP